MRILHLSTRMILGGSQENTVLSCEGQARLGHEVHLAFGPVYGPEGSLVARVEEFNRRCADGRERVRPIRTQHAAAACVRPEGSAVLPVTMHMVPTLLREVRPLADRRCAAALRRLIETLRPDVVHTHSSKAGVLGRIAAWRVREGWSNAARAGASGRPAMAIVHTIHGPPFMPPEGSPIARAKTALVNRVYEAAERRAARRCDVIVSVADAMTASFLARAIGRAEQYVTVRSGMEVGAFLHAAPGETRSEVRAPLDIPPGAFVVGTVARLAQHKGHHDLLEALGDLVRAPEGITLLWVGDGWWRGRLLQRARAMGLRVRELDAGARPGSDAMPPSSIAAAHPGGTRAARDDDAGDEESRESKGRTGELVVTGLVGPERVAGLMRAMDVLAHPSSREGLPRTVPQALLCGICPVAYDADGTREVCVEGETGRLVAVGDVAGLRRAVEELRANDTVRRELADRGRRMCVQHFSAEAMVAHLERVYRQALGTSTR